MGNHKKYRIKSLYDNIMAVKTGLQTVRHRTSYRMRAMLQGLRMQTIPVIFLPIRQPTRRLFLTSFVSLNLTALRHRLKQRMTELQSYSHSLMRLTLRHHRQHKTPLYSRDSVTRLTLYIIGSILVQSQQPRFSDAPRFSSAITTDAVADAMVAVSKEV